MALYEYHCEDCDETFTVSERISEHEKHRKPPKCPECGGKKTRQLISGFFAKTSSKA